MALLVPTLMAYGHDLMFGVVLLGAMWPVGLCGHYIIGVMDQRFGTKKIALMVIAILALGGLLIFVGGGSSVVCVIAIVSAVFGATYSMLATFLICCFALIPIAALPYKQIGSQIHEK